MVKLTVFHTNGHIQCDIVGIDIDKDCKEKNIAILCTTDYGLISAFEYLFPGLIKDKVSHKIHHFMVINLSTIPLFAVKYKGTELTDFVFGSREWLQKGGLDAIEEMNNILSPPISPDFDLIDMPICGGCPTDLDCKNCPIL